MIPTVRRLLLGGLCGCRSPVIRVIREIRGDHLGSSVKGRWPTAEAG